jgi:nitrilase
MQVAAIQMTSTMDVKENFLMTQRLLEQAAAKGSILAVLPENFAFLGQGPDFKKARLVIQEDLGVGPIQDFLANTAKRLNLWIIAGSIPIKSSDVLRPYAACLVFNAKGECVAHYNKMHLFDVVLSDTEQYRESESITPGDECVVVQTPVGKMGLSICYDLRFPEFYRLLVEKGAEILALPAAFTLTTGKMHWDVLIRALAIQQFSYVIAAGQTGIHGMGRQTYGHSAIISPKGEVLSQLSEEVGVITAEVDLDDLAQYRKRIPVLENNKTSIF